LNITSECSLIYSSTKLLFVTDGHCVLPTSLYLSVTSIQQCMPNLRQRYSLNCVCTCHLSNWPASVESSCRSRRHKSSQISLSAILTACKEDQFECAPGYCVPLSRRCDGYTDCIGGRDEQNCYNMSTNYHYLLQSTAKRHTQRETCKSVGIGIMWPHICARNSLYVCQETHLTR